MGGLDTGLVDRVKVGRAYYYMNVPLMKLFINVSDGIEESDVLPIESVSE